ncbi:MULTISPECIES: type III-B CRISPR-associated protein Cas10/Cmr2 [unclassified Nostoc]|uniref:type III-B CRISPR-associated protein Cas10/Cmr2 n=1 Tax=unclassified Nostoc TaxID=2593658 RepID=UPI002AD263BB|nr:type III-B CRISPR-associated protein Cas10/Cmr2 [Nostoc sp. DedQUE03]MDZ7973411.1 type III-B CRISPR-associated protein Cas10/Cmr2 [Nostoc sp. DedQUE03]MDZ8045314.1 type III-B CRISPR-associated protein Cas10/Cmr2 [Nostoc sp. DedQUE02]
MTKDARTRTITALAWCLAWGEKHNLNQDELSMLHQMRQGLQQGKVVPKSMPSFVEQAQRLYDIPEDYAPKTLKELKDNPDYSKLWEDKTPIGLVYGGATKIKQYVFEAAKLNDIRGASALLDRINLDDIPSFFGEGKRSPKMRKWLNDNQFVELRQALIPELIIYSTGGSILAFCPAAFVHQLANAIEKRYTHETLTANSCAVGDTFRLLEFRFGLLQKPIENTLWLEEYKNKQNNPIIKAYFDQSHDESYLDKAKEPEPNSDKLKELILEAKFWQRKNFNELVGKLANQFTHRRNGNASPKAERPSRCYPPMFETHPYLQRDGTDNRSAVAETNLPGTPSFSDALARKVIVGQRSKRDARQHRGWYKHFRFRLASGEERLWKPGYFPSWVTRFGKFLENENHEGSGCLEEYYRVTEGSPVTQALSLREIGNVSTPRGFVGYIYADGNNMGGYLRQHIRTPEKYREFSEQVLKATQNSVYIALKKHLQPRQLNHLTDPDNIKRNRQWIYPFEIITIGGDDVLLIVPADKALDIAKSIGEEFEREILKSSKFKLNKPYDPEKVHRYQGENPSEYTSQCELSMSAGVLITAENTPIYYAEELTNQLLKSSKKLAKELKRKYNYYGGTIDFLTLKAVTMIASNIKDFREEGLTKGNLNFYASPYTLHELGGLLQTVKVLKKANFPKSQLYQIRSLLERGKHTAILNYRYFRVRLQQGQNQLETGFEKAWCKPKDETNHGNLAPWMSRKSKESDADAEKTIYETIWRDLVDLYPFIVEDDQTPANQGEQQEQGVNQ